jgi:hypothetical protein
MFGKLFGGVCWRHSSCLLFALCAGSLLAAMILSAVPAAAQNATLFNNGFRWIGTAQICTAPPEWIAEPLFPPSNLPGGTNRSPALNAFCLYTWRQMGRAWIRPLTKSPSWSA